MRLVSYLDSHGQIRWGELAPGSTGGVKSCDVIDRGSGDLGAFLRSGGDLAGTRPGATVGAAQLLAPVLTPGKIVAVGLNYVDHALEQGKPPPTHPILFSKAPSALTGPDGVIELPLDRPHIDVEVELVAVIGHRMRRVTAAEALDGVLGYTLGNDVTDRAAQKDDGQFYRAKSYDTFAPLGPWMDTEFRPAAQTIQLRRNGAIFQESRLNQLLFPLAELLAQISRWQTLEPGDLVFTGTPPGVGAHRKPPVWLAAGDEICCSIEGLGELTNVVAEPR